MNRVGELAEEGEEDNTRKELALVPLLVVGNKVVVVVLLLLLFEVILSVDIGMEGGNSMGEVLGVETDELLSNLP